MNHETWHGMTGRGAATSNDWSAQFTGNDFGYGTQRRGVRDSAGKHPLVRTPQGMDEAAHIVPNFQGPRAPA